MTDLQTPLRELFGFDAFRPGQEEVVRAAVEANSPPMRHSRVPKIFYATQIGVHPPTVVLFTNGPELFDDTYVRYLVKVLRDSFPFSEVAIKVVLRAKGEGGGGSRRDDGGVSNDELGRVHERQLHAA